MSHATKSILIVLLVSALLGAMAWAQTRPTITEQYLMLIKCHLLATKGMQK